MLSKRIIRVFPRRTTATPCDDLVRIGVAPDLFEEADEVHISVSFTWDLPLAEKLQKAWSWVAPTKIGGPATGDTGGEFCPGMYLKKGLIIHHRGCPNSCWYCIERKTKMKLCGVNIGWNDLSSNLLACPDDHFLSVMSALKEGKKVYKKRAELTGGLEAKRLTEWHVDKLRELRPKQMFFAYDSEDELEHIKRAGAMLLSTGWTVASHTLRCYVLCGYPKDTFRAAERRVSDVINAGFMPMAMLYRDVNGTRDVEWMRWQRQWANAHLISKKIQ